MFTINNDIKLKVFGVYSVRNNVSKIIKKNSIPEFTVLIQIPSVNLCFNFGVLLATFIYYNLIYLIKHFNYLSICF